MPVAGCQSLSSPIVKFRTFFMAPLCFLVLGLYSPEMGCGSFGLSGKLLGTNVGQHPFSSY